MARRRGAARLAVLSICGGLGLTATSAMALDEGKEEKARLKACEASLCKLVGSKAPGDGYFTCGLAKTWLSDKIKEGAASGHVSWSHGDARCKLDVRVPRADILEALKGGEYTFQFPEHTVHCEVEKGGALTPVRLRFAPKVIFKGGQARKAWVNLKHVDGPGHIKGIAVTLAKLEDSLGLFHKPLIRAINAQIGEKCQKLSTGG